MSRRSSIALLNDMLDHAREAVAFVQGCSRADLDSNRLLNLALVRLMEIVGEAASQIPKASQASLPQIPWPQIVSLRNRLIHGYDSVDLDMPLADHHYRFAAIDHSVGRNPNRQGRTVIADPRLFLS